MQVATGSLDGTARIWDAAAGQPRRTLAGHSSWIKALAYAPSGAMIATGSGDNTARMWHATTGAGLATLRGHSGEVTAVAFAPDGALLATASDDRTARLWDTASGAHVRTLAGHDSWVQGVAFSSRGLIGTASWDNTAKIWDDRRRYACLATLTGHTGTSGVRRVLAGRCAAAATASGDATARLWAVATGAHLVTLAGHDYTVLAVAFSPDGALLATASADATARLWDVASGAHLATLVPLPAAGYITLLPDDRYKLGGDPGDCLWWAAGLDRLGPDEVHHRFPEGPQSSRPPPRSPAPLTRYRPYLEYRHARRQGALELPSAKATANVVARRSKPVSIRCLPALACYGTYAPLWDEFDACGGRWPDG